MYIITGIDEETGEIIYWNNKFGWCEGRNDATQFKHNEHRLPLGTNVHWEKTTEDEDADI